MKIQVNDSSGNFLLEELKQRSFSQNNRIDKESSDTNKSFFDHLTEAVKDTNKVQKESQKMATDLITGKDQNIHETMLKASHAELSFKLMVQVRNKALEAYQEIMRMPV